MTTALENSVWIAPVGALTLAGAARTEAGQPVQRFKKDLLRAGVDYHKASTGQSFKFTTADLDAKVASFASMTANGVKVPLPVGHTNDAEANRGYAVDMYRDGDTLYATVDMIGDDAIKLAARSEVSVFMPPELIDGKGNRYSQPITHIAIVTDPVVPDQGGFIPIAASRGSTDKPIKAPVYRLQGTDMDISKIALALGLAATATLDQITEAAGKAKTTIDTQAAKITEQAGKITETATALSRATAEKPKPTPTEIRLTRELRTTKIEGLVSKGKASPAQAKAMTAKYVGDDAALALSMDSAAHDDFDAVVGLLALNTGLVTGSQMGGQGNVSLNRGDTSEDDTKTVARMAGYVNGPAKA